MSLGGVARAISPSRGARCAGTSFGGSRWFGRLGRNRHGCRTRYGTEASARGVAVADEMDLLAVGAKSFLVAVCLDPRGHVRGPLFEGLDERLIPRGRGNFSVLGRHSQLSRTLLDALDQLAQRNDVVFVFVVHEPRLVENESEESKLRK